MNGSIYVSFHSVKVSKGNICLDCIGINLDGFCKLFNGLITIIRK